MTDTAPGPPADLAKSVNDWLAAVAVRFPRRARLFSRALRRPFWLKAFVVTQLWRRD